MQLSCPRCRGVLDMPVDLYHGGEEFLCTQCHAMLRVTMTIDVIEPAGRPKPAPGPAPMPRIVAAFRGEASLEVVKELLIPAGFDVTTTTTGRDTLHLIDELNPIIVIVEDTLADLSGLDLCELLKRSKRHPGLKVLLVMAGHGADGLDETSMLYGPDAHMMRSALYKELVERVRLLMQLPSQDRGAAHAPPYPVDPDATRLMSDPQGRRPLPGR